MRHVHECFCSLHLVPRPYRFEASRVLCRQLLEELQEMAFVHGAEALGGPLRQGAGLLHFLIVKRRLGPTWLRMLRLLLLMFRLFYVVELVLFLLFLLLVLLCLLLG